VALDPADGDLLWSQPGDPPFIEGGQLGQELAFAADRFFVGFDEWPFSQISLLYGVSLDGDQLFAVGRPDRDPQPVMSPDGTLYVRTWVPSGGIRLGAYDQDGHIQWIAFQSPTNVLTDPDVGPDGATYSVRNLNQLWALEPDGSTRWTVTTDGAMGRPIVSPAGDLLIVGGNEIGQYGFFRAFDLGGQQLWQQTLSGEPDGALLTFTAAAMFDAGGTTAYVPVSRNWNPPINQHCYVYALAATAQQAIFADGFESGDLSAWSTALQ
jgi:outer membrane protein assembly factor BamB